MSREDLEAIYGNQLPMINPAILAEANALSIEHNCSFDEALLYILDGMTNPPFEE